MTPLYATPQWILVLLVPLDNGKSDKLPIDWRTGEVTPKGSDGAHNSAIWTTYEHATTLAQKWGGAVNGAGFTVGYVLTRDDPFFCCDIDDARMPDGSWSALAQQLCAALPGCSIEISQSGKGLHVWGYGPVPPHSNKNVPLKIELYSERRFIAIGHSAVGEMVNPCPRIAQVAAHYFPPKETVTVHGDGPRPEWRGPVDDSELIRRALQSRSAANVFGSDRASFSDLWERNVEVLARAYPPDSSSTDRYDESSADAGLCQHLAFWTGCDQERMVRLMHASGLRRSKYDRDDYMHRTVTNACALQREVLQDKPPPAPPVPVAHDAPKMVAAEGNRFLAPADQAALFAGCIYVIDEHKALVPGGTLLRPDQFRAVHGGYTFTMDNRNERTTRNAWEAFTESQVLTAPRADGTCFRPQLPYGATVKNEGRTRANTYWPIEVRRVDGSPEPFERHLQLLLPHDWRVLLHYMAGLVQFPGVKFQWMPLLVGAEGNGKTFFSRCVMHAVGERYTHWPKAKELDNKFNKWMLNKLFYAIEDLKIGDQTTLWETLKPMITGANIEIEGKGVDQRSDEICGNFIANSNHLDAIRATRNDRRVAHLHCAQQTVDDLARDGIDERYTSGLYDWAQRDGYAIVAEYLHTLVIPPEFGKSWLTGRAPSTTARAAAIEHGRSPVEQALLDAIEAERPGFAAGWVSSVMAEKLIEGRRMLGQFPRAGRESILRGLGYVRHPALAANKGRVSHVVMPDGAKPTLYVREGHQALAIQTGAEVARAYTTAQGGL